jgi:hypothetical protein
MQDTTLGSLFGSHAVDRCSSDESWLCPVHCITVSLSLVQFACLSACLSVQMSGAACLSFLWQHGGETGCPPMCVCLSVCLQKRLVRASAIHGLAGMAAKMATTYKAYLGEGLGPFGDWLQQFKIPHPGRVGGLSDCQ